jgi:hypothetical protein
MEYNRTMNETTFENKTQILADLWLNYRADGDFTDFVEYNDLGLPLAYAISAGIVPATDRAREFVEETFALLLASLDIEEDTGFDNLDDLLQLDD